MKGITMKVVQMNHIVKDRCSTTKNSISIKLEITEIFQNRS